MHLEQLPLQHQQAHPTLLLLQRCCLAGLLLARLPALLLPVHLLLLLLGKSLGPHQLQQLQLQALLHWQCQQLQEQQTHH
jgi:hypothetical protein